MVSQLRFVCLGAFIVAFTAGCDALQGVHDLPEEPPAFPTRETASVSDRHGGTHHRTEVEGRIWYQTFGTELLVLDSHDGTELRRVEALPFGTSGALVDMALLDKRLYVVADGDAVIEFDLEDQRRPTVRQVRPMSELGIRPRAIAAIDGTIWISGDGGVVSWSASEDPFLNGEQVTAPVVKTGKGLAVPVGRRVHAIKDGTYLGSATSLVPLPDQAGIEGAMMFVLQGAEGASVGLMGPDVRQIDDFVMRGRVHALRYANGRLWAIGEQEIGTAELSSVGRLGPVQWIKVKGARDLDEAGPNYLALGGTFGRALYRHEQDSTGEADSFLAVTREPGNLRAAVDDGRRVLTGSIEGSWLYTIGDSIEIVNRDITMDIPPTDFAAAKWGDVRIVDDGRAVIIHLDEVDREWSAPNEATIRTLVVVDERIWIGHDEGLFLIRINGSAEAAEHAYFDLPPPPRMELAKDIRIPSGISHVIPVRVGNEVVWVSPNGGVGVAKAERVPLKAWASQAD